MGQGRPAGGREKYSSDQAQGAKAYGRGYGDADSPPQANKTRNKTKQNKGEPTRGRPGPARPDRQTAILILVCVPAARQVGSQ